MFEELDFEEVVERMLSNVSDEFDKREGSVIYDAVAPAALELVNFYIALDIVLDEVFADTASYYYLMKRAAERGIYPKEETYAVCRMEVLPPDTPISVGDRFNLNTLNYTVSSAIDADAGMYQLTCETAGISGNQQLGELLAIETENDINDMQSANLTEILIPGEDEEDVEAFRERYFASFAAEAFGGNKQDYREKVNDIDGVGGCKTMKAWKSGYHPSEMIPGAAVKEWFGQQSEKTLGADVYGWIEKVYGAADEKLLTVGGTVKCYIITSEFRAPSSVMVQTVQDALDPDGSAGEGEGIAPIGHVVKVYGVREVPVDVDVSLALREGYSFERMQADIEDIIDSYFLELAKEWESSDNLTVRVSQIEARILLLEGVIDIVNIKINGASENIILEWDAIPVRGEVNG